MVCLEPVNTLLGKDHLPGTLAMQRTWELQTKKLSRMFPGWLASMTTALVVAWVLVQIHTKDDSSPCCFNSFCWSCQHTWDDVQVFNYTTHVWWTCQEYLQLLIKFVQAALRSHFPFRTLGSRQVAVKHAGSYNGASVSGFTSREVHTSSTPQLQHKTVREAMKENGNGLIFSNTEAVWAVLSLTFETKAFYITSQRKCDLG